MWLSGTGAVHRRGYASIARKRRRRLKTCQGSTNQSAVDAALDDDWWRPSYIYIPRGPSKWHPFQLYVNVMPYKLQNTGYLYCLNNFKHLLLIIPSLNVLICFWKYFDNSFGTPVFLHTQAVNQTAFIVSIIQASWRNYNWIRTQTELVHSGRLRTTSFNEMFRE